MFRLDVQDVQLCGIYSCGRPPQGVGSAAEAKPFKSGRGSGGPFRLPRGSSCSDINIGTEGLWEGPPSSRQGIRKGSAAEAVGQKTMLFRINFLFDFRTVFLFDFGSFLDHFWDTFSTIFASFSTTSSGCDFFLLFASISGPPSASKPSISLDTSFKNHKIWYTKKNITFGEHFRLKIHTKSVFESPWNP